MDASKKFFTRMFFVFFLCTVPTSSMAKPACIQKTSTPPKMSQKALRSECSCAPAAFKLSTSAVSNSIAACISSMVAM